MSSLIVLITIVIGTVVLFHVFLCVLSLVSLHLSRKLHFAQFDEEPYQVAQVLFIVNQRFRNFKVTLFVDYV